MRRTAAACRNISFIYHLLDRAAASNRSLYAKRTLGSVAGIGTAALSGIGKASATAVFIRNRRRAIVIVRIRPVVRCGRGGKVIGLPWVNIIAKPGTRNLIRSISRI